MILDQREYVKMSNNTPPVLYWIHHRDHTDIYTQGYIGITSKKFKYRLGHHYYNAEQGLLGKRDDSEYGIVHRAINKHKENIVSSILCVGSLEYVLDLELKLRPTRNIGWNIDCGGSRGGLGRKHTEEHKQYMRDIKKGKSLSKKCLDAAVLANKNRDRTVECLMHSETIKNRHILDLSRTNFNTLKHVNVIYKFYLEKCKRKQILDTLRLPESTSLVGLLGRFSRGWNPMKDERMQNWLLEKGCDLSLSLEVVNRKNSKSYKMNGCVEFKTAREAYDILRDVIYLGTYSDFTGCITKVASGYPKSKTAYGQHWEYLA